MTKPVGGRLRGPNRWMLLLLAGVVVFSGLAACAGDSSESNGDEAGIVPRTVEPGKPMSDVPIEQLTIGIPGQVPTLNPLGNSEAGLYSNSLGLESLFRIDADGELSPWLATGYEQVSPTVYEYTLREGVTFWDGTEMTSEDVAFSWNKRIEQSEIFFMKIASIETPDDHTVRVNLSAPDASWESTPGMYYSNIFQKAFFEENEETFGQPGTLVIGTGPWQFDELNPTTSLELSAYQGYWGGAPPIEHVSVKFFADESSMALALRAGEIDITPSVTSPAGFDAAAGGGVITTASTCAAAVLSLPTTTGPWSDVHVRRAAALAVNRDDVIASTQGAAGDPLYTLSSPKLLSGLGSDDEVGAALDSVPTYDFDVEAAKAELAKSAYPDGFEGEFLTHESYSAQSQVMAAQLAEIGIDLTLRSVGWTAWYAEALDPELPAPLTFTETGTCAPDPSFSDFWLGAQILNLASWTPPEIDALVADGLSSQDPAERLGIYTEILQKVGEEVPYIPIYEVGFTFASLDYQIADYGSYYVNTPWLLDLLPK